jgi:hypothetical protein
VASQTQRLRAARDAHSNGDWTERDRLVAASVAALHVASADADRASCAHSLASFYRDIGALAESERYARLAVDWVRRSGAVSLLGNHLMFLALLLHDMVNVGEAVQHAEEALSCYTRTHGPDHGETRYVADVVANLRKQRPGSSGGDGAAIDSRG